MPVSPHSGDLAPEGMVAGADRSGKSRRSRAASRRAGSRTRRKPAARSDNGAPRRWVQLLDLVGLLAGLFVILALLSHDGTDPGFSRSSSAGVVANWGGVLGAWTADIAFQLVGYAAWASLLSPAIFLRRLARRAALGLLGKIASAVAVFGVATGLALALPSHAAQLFPPGGILGLVAAAGLTSLVGGPGAWLVVIGVVAASCTLAFGFDLQTFAERSLQLAERGWGASMSTAASGASGAGRLAGRGARALGARSLVVLVSLPLSLARGLLRLPGRAWRALGRRRAQGPEAAVSEALPIDQSLLEEDSLPPSMRPGPDDAPSTRSGLERPVPGDSIAARPGERPTVVGVRELVEADWEPTEHGLGPMDDERGTDFWDPAWRGSTQGDVSSGAELGAGAGDGEQRPSTAEVVVVQVEGLPSSVVDAPEPASLPESVARADSSLLLDAPPAPVPVPRSGGEDPVDPRSVSLEPGNLESGGNDLRGQVLLPTDPGAPYELPDMGLLDRHDRSVAAYDELGLRRLAGSLEDKLASFGINGEVTAIRPGPVITIFEYLPAPGVKISKIASLQDDIAMAMRALRVRIVAPIPGKGVVGIEIPAADRQIVWIRDILASGAFRESKQALPLVLGKSVDGRPVVTDLAKMPHLLVGGATGSGKSVGINAMLTSLLYTRTPAELRIIMVDPKVLEFEPYRDIPHLLHPVVTEAKLANAALKWAVEEMERRYRLLARWGTRNIRGYNDRVQRELEDWNEDKARRLAPADWNPGEPLPQPEKLPYIVIVIDELADLMKQVGKEVEESIVRLAQKARAAGLHLVVATQRPSVDVITGLIKANFPSRIAFQVRARTDGRTILDQNGAETLLGMGDMLYLPPGVSALQRVHGAFVSDEEVRRITDHLRDQGVPRYDARIRLDEEAGEFDLSDDDYDEYYDLAVRLVAEARKASTSMLQRHLKIGYNRAARIIEMMEREGVVGPADGSRPREVLISPMVDQAP